MLYLTTRTRFDAYTSHHALYEDRGPDGGYYVPFRMPVFSPEEIASLKDKSFCATVSEILGLFFNERISFWDVEFCIGKRPAKVVELPQNLLVAELWHRESGLISTLERAIYCKLTGVDTDRLPSWPAIAIRIAFLFAVFGELLKNGQISDQAPDMSIPAGDCRTLMAVWYAKKMGLPVGQILCGCDEGSGVWDLLHLGEGKPSGSPKELERLIFGALGLEETLSMVSAMGAGTVYTPFPGRLTELRRDIYCAVVSQSRTVSAISGIFRSTGYVGGPHTAVSYCALQDYRAKSGGNRLTLILAGKSPLSDKGLTCQALGITEARLRELMR